MSQRSGSIIGFPGNTDDLTTLNDDIEICEHTENRVKKLLGGIIHITLKRIKNELIMRENR